MGVNVFNTRFFASEFLILKIQGRGLLERLELWYSGLEVTSVSNQDNGSKLFAVSRSGNSTSAIIKEEKGASKISSSTFSVESLMGMR